MVLLLRVKVGSGNGVSHYGELETAIIVVAVVTVMMIMVVTVVVVMGLMVVRGDDGRNGDGDGDCQS